MKKLLFLVCLTPLFAFHSLTTEANIVGKWKGEDKGDIGFIYFDEEGFALFETGGQKMGGKEFTFKGQKAQMTYQLNTDTKPMELDFIITILDKKEANTLMAIIEFEDDDKIHMALGFGGSDRPTSFDDENSIYLFREK